MESGLGLVPKWVLVWELMLVEWVELVLELLLVFVRELWSCKGEMLG